MGLQHGLAVRKYEARNMAGAAEFHQSANLRRQGNTAAPGTYHKHHRDILRIRHFPCAGLGGAAQSIVKAHGPFQDRQLPPLLSKRPRNPVFSL